MKGEYQRRADDIARRINDAEINGGLRPKEIVGKILGGDVDNGNYVNCYPGTGSNGCSKEAYFFSLKGRGHYNFHEILCKLIQHMQGHCSAGKTRVGLIFCDSWSPNELDPWLDNIRVIINSGVYLEFYLIRKGTATLVPV